MVEVDATTERTAGVTLVRASVENTQTTPQRVRLRNLLDGPTWSPRAGDVPAPEWDGDAWETVLRPGERRGLGFATPADPADPPVEVVSETRATADRERRPGSVLATLDGWAPPRRVVVDRRTETR